MSFTTCPSLRELVIIMAVTVLLVSGKTQDARATVVYWTGGGTNANWSTAANWNAAKPSNLEAVFDSGSTNLTNTIDSVDAFGSLEALTLNDTTGDVTIDVQTATDIGRTGVGTARWGIYLDEVAGNTTNLYLNGGPVTMYYLNDLSVGAGRTVFSNGGMMMPSDQTDAVYKKGDGRAVLGGATDNSLLDLKVTAGTVELNKTSSTDIHAVRAIGAIDAGATVKQTGVGAFQIDQSGTVTMTGGTYDLNGNDYGSTTVRGASFSGYGKLINTSSTSVKVYANSMTANEGQFEIVANEGTIEIDSAGYSMTNAPNGPELAINDPHVPGQLGDPRQDPFYHDSFWNWGGGVGSPRPYTFFIMTGTGTVKLTGTENTQGGFMAAVMCGTLELGHDQYDDAGITKNTKAVGKIQFLATGSLVRQTGTSVKQVSPGGNVHMDGGTFDLNGRDFGDPTLTGVERQSSESGNSAWAIDMMSQPAASPINYSYSPWTKSVITNSSATAVAVNPRRTEMYGNLEITPIGDIRWLGSIGASSNWGAPNGTRYYRDAGSLTKSGDGTLYVTGATVYKGGTVVRH